VSTFSFRSFAGGEIAPSLWARVDTQKYQTGAAKIKNFVVMKHGGLTRTPGTEFVGQAPAPAGASRTRLIPWLQESTSRDEDSSSFIVEMSQHRMRFIRNGLYEYSWESPISSVSAAGIVRTTKRSGNLSPPIREGETVTMVDVVGFKDINNRLYKVSSVDAANGYITLMSLDGDDVAWEGAYSTGGTIYRVYELATPYRSYQLPGIRYSQSQGVMTLVHHAHPIYELRNGAGRGAWSLEPRENRVTIGSPTSIKIDGTWTKFWKSTLPADGGNVVVARKGGTFSRTSESATKTSPSRVNARFGQWNDIKYLSGTWFGLEYNFKTRSAEETTIEEAYRIWEGSSAKTPEYRRWAITSVDEDGNESLPAYSGYALQEPDAVIQNLHGGSSDLQLRYLTCVDSVNEQLRGQPRRIFIENFDGYSVGTSDKWTIRGTDYLGKDVTEVLSAATSVTGAAGDAHVVSENYFSNITEILNNETSSDWVAVGLAERDMDRFTVRWSKPTYPQNWVGTKPADPASYRIYRSNGAQFGFVGSTTETSFIDLGAEADYTDQPATGNSPFSRLMWKDGNPEGSRMSYPTAVSHFQQSQVFGGSDIHKERIWKSAIGQPYNFDSRIPTKPSDAFYWDIAGQKLNRIMHILSLSKMIVFTQSGEWVAMGDESGAITPDTINMVQQSEYGIGVIPPIAIGNDAVFIQPRGPVIRDLGYRAESSGYKGDDLTVFSNHLFRGYGIVDWCYQQGPDSILWVVRSDGKVLGLTYLKEHQIFAWHQHDFGGKVKSIACIPEDDYGDSRDSVYMVVARTIDGKSQQYVERMSRTKVKNFIDYNYLTAAVHYNGWTDYSDWKEAKFQFTTLTSLASPAADNPRGWGTGTTAEIKITEDSEYVLSAKSVGETLQLSSDDLPLFRIKITSWSKATPTKAQVVLMTPVAYRFINIPRQGAPRPTLSAGVGTVMTITQASGASNYSRIVLTCDRSGYFSSESIGDEVWFGSWNNVTLRARIVSVTSSTVAEAVPDRDVPASLQDVSVYSWGYALKEIGGLEHLEGEKVGVFADGYVMASPNNPAYADLTVSSLGYITLPRPACVIRVGLPMTSDLQTLDIDSVGGETISDKKKIVQRVTMHMDTAAGGFVGLSEPTGDDPLENLTEMRYDIPDRYESTKSNVGRGQYSSIVPSTWGKGGKIFVRQVDPLPLDILAIHPTLDVAERRNTRE
jgi:hypothetical protein